MRLSNRLSKHNTSQINKALMEQKLQSKRYYKALREEQRTEAKLDKLKGELSSLLRNRDDNEVELRNALEAYAKASCLALCNKVLATFPREIRDTIYSHTVPEGPVDIVGGDSYSDPFRAASRNSISRPCTHLMNSDFVGNEIVKEIGEAYLRFSIFSIGQDYASLIGFRIMDRYGLGLIPVEFILNVEVHIDCDIYDFQGLEPETGPGLPWGWALLSSLELLKILEYLFGFKAGTKITIDLNVDDQRLQAGTSPQQWEWDNVVPFIFPTLRRLSAAGYKLRVRLDSDEFVLVAHDSNYSLEGWKTKFDEYKKNVAEKDAIDAMTYGALWGLGIDNGDPTEEGDEWGDTTFDDREEEESALLNIRDLFIED